LIDPRLAWLFELSGGALTDTVDSCLPKAAREATFTIVALHQWKLEMDDPACVLTAEEWIKDTLALQSTGGPFPCVSALLNMIQIARLICNIITVPGAT
jgi:hypothetical protein